MDIKLLQDAPEFINDVQTAFEGAGEYGLNSDPYGNVIRDFRQSAVDSYLRDHEDEFASIIAFANKWDIDVNEYELDTLEQKFEFCVMYISFQISSEKEFNSLKEAI